MQQIRHLNLFWICSSFNFSMFETKIGRGCANKGPHNNKLWCRLHHLGRP